MHERASMGAPPPPFALMLVLAFIQVVVRNAGHMTPAFAPRASYEMFYRFVQGLCNANKYLRRRSP